MEDAKQEQQEENKNHSDPNGKYAEDCFLFDMTENSSIDKYNPKRYLTFNYLSSGVAHLKGRIETKDIELDPLMPNYFKYQDIPYNFLDEYLHEAVYQARIDNWIDEVKKSKAKAVKVVLNTHGSKDRYLIHPNPNSCEHIQKDAKTKELKYTGEFMQYDRRTIECLKYFFQKLAEVKKNINIVNLACHAAEYLDEKKQQSIIELIKPLAEKIHNYKKDIIYTCNYSEKNVARTECWRRYYIYDGKRKEFVSLSPNLDSNDRLKQNVEDYGKYTNDSSDETAKLQAEYYYDRRNPEYGAKYREADLRFGAAFIRDIQDKLSLYGITKEQKEWAQKKIKELDDDLKNWQSLQKKIKFLNNIKLERENLINQENIDVRKVTAQAKSDFSKIIKRQTTKIEKDRMKSLFDNTYLENFEQNLEKANEALRQEQQKNIQCWKVFFQKHPECLGRWTDNVKLHHKRHRSHELFFDDKTLKQMKEAKDKKNEILFELNKDKNKEEEKNKNEIKTEANVNLTDQDKNKSQINEIK